MVPLIAAGIFLIILGLILLTDWIDGYTRGYRALPLPRQRTTSRMTSQLPKIPPFIYSDTQCLGCGKDGELLDLATKRCGICQPLFYLQGESNG